MPKNIVMMTMAMDIGGAETHIFELSRALVLRGHKVTVFSAGGAYVKELEKCGIKHITAPFRSKSPSALRKAKRIVSEFIKQNPDVIIHSHARIANFTANSVSKKFGVPFVSTVHGKFSTGILQRIFTKWGIRALTVSEDLKQHTFEYYGFPKDKMRVTVNGVNLNVFKPGVDNEFKSQLGYDQNHKIILCVTRLNDTACIHVQRLLSMAKDIYAKNNDARILIVGSGNKHKELMALGQKINKETQDGFIKFAGAQTDIYKYCKIADMFFGISRSALEAMACKKPVVLYGNMGYLGLMDESNKDDCISTNFTCRSFPFPENEKVVALIADILSNPQAYERYTQYAYELIKDNYSVERMADDALLTYAEAQGDLSPFDTMICGYYGRQNLGDELLLRTMTDSIGAKRSVVITANTKEKSVGIEKAVHRFDLLKIIKYMKKTKLFILGAGSLLQDVTSSRSLYYYIFISKLAKRNGCKLMLYANGIEPLKNKKHEKAVAKLISSANCVTLRDSSSYQYIKNIGADCKNVITAADEAFMIDLSDYDTKSDKKYVIVNVHDKKAVSGLAKAINAACEKHGLIAMLLPMHPKQDMPALERLSKKLECEHTLIQERLNEQQVLSLFAKSEMTIAQRLHAIIFSALARKPFIATHNDAKVRALCKELELEDYVSNGDDIYNVIEKANREQDRISKALKERVPLLKERAGLSSQKAKSILDLRG